MNFISLFSGIGGLDLGLERTGMKCIAQVEIDEFCQKILNKHWPDVQKFRDIRDVKKEDFKKPASLICGGFPCQDVSHAGKRLGLDGERSILWKEYFRLICEIEPRWIVAENVIGLLSANNGEFFGTVLRDLARTGYYVQWRVLQASKFHAPHSRKRVIVIAHSNQIRQGDIFSNIAWIQTKEKPQLWDAFRTDGREVFVETARRVLGDYDGFPFKLDRLGALGNAVVPQVAEFVGHCIMNYEAQNLSPSETGNIAK